jgi:hypothetical protein
MGEGEPGGPGRLPMNAVDCPDGLARCNGGSVLAARLAAIPRPCDRPPPQCECPWDLVAQCERGCAAEGLELVIERSLAPIQLCAPGADGGSVSVVRTTRVAPSPGSCEQGQLYRCFGRDVVACHENAIVGTCVRGCFTPEAAIEDGEPVGREAAFAVLCSR